MSDLKDDGNVSLIKSRLNRLGLILDPYLDDVFKIYPPNGPKGFDFHCKDIKGLFQTVRENPHFGYDNPLKMAGHLATELAHGMSFREVNDVDSLHFEIAKDFCNLHLDSVSVVAGKDEDGDIIYNTANLGQHLLNDHLNYKRIIGPNEKDGFVLGFRF